MDSFLSSIFEFISLAVGISYFGLLAACCLEQKYIKPFLRPYQDLQRRIYMEKDHEFPLWKLIMNHQVSKIKARVQNIRKRAPNFQVKWWHILLLVWIILIMLPDPSSKKRINIKKKYNCLCQ
jgi:hypothetical protein